MTTYLAARWANDEQSAAIVTTDDAGDIALSAADTPTEWAALLASGIVIQTPQPTTAELIAYAATARWRKETGGITVGGIPIATDDRSKQMIMGVRIAADADAGFTTPWVAADGAIHTVDAATVIAISNAVLAHVAACFATYAAVKAAIDDETITTFAEIDAAFA